MNLRPGERPYAAVLILVEQQDGSRKCDVCEVNRTFGLLCAENHVYRQVKRHIDASAGDVLEAGGDVLFNSLVDVVHSDNFAQRGAVRAGHEFYCQQVGFSILIIHDVSSLVERPSPGVGEHDEKRTAGRRPKLLRKHAQKLEH